MRDGVPHVISPSDRDEDVIFTKVAGPPSPQDGSASSSSRSPSSTTSSGTTQGSFVSSFNMPMSEQIAAIALAQSQLAPLLAECGSDSSGWRRIRGKKGANVKLWEKGCGATRARSSGGPKLRLLRQNAPPPATVVHGTDSSRMETGTASASPSSASRPSASASPFPACYAVRSSATIKAPLELVMQVLDCATATAHRSFTKIIYEQLVADTSVLFHSQQQSWPPSSTGQTAMANGASGASVCSLAVRWLVAKCQAPLVSDYDFCLAEYSKVHGVDDVNDRAAFPSNNNNDDNDDSNNSDPSQDSYGTDPHCSGLRRRAVMPTAFKVLHSIESRHCPELQATHHLMRAHMPLGGFLFYPTDHSDVTDVVCYLSMADTRQRSGSGGGSTHHSATSPRSLGHDRQFRALQLVLQRMALALARVGNAVDAWLLSQQMAAMRSTRWVENGARPECVVCFRRFHPLTRRRHHCRMCGDVICRLCSLQKDADLPTVGPTTLRICRLCDTEHFTHLSTATVTVTVPQDVPRSTRPTLRIDATASAATTTTSMARRSKACMSPMPTRSSVAGAPFARRHSVDQAMSCPKASIQRTAAAGGGGGGGGVGMASPGAQRWSKAFYASRAMASSPVPTEMENKATARMVTPHPVSCSKAAMQAASPSQRFQFRIDRNHTGLASTMKTASSSSPPAVIRQRGRGRAATHDSSSNQLHGEPARGHEETSPTNREGVDLKGVSMGRRITLNPLEPYERLLRELCEQASACTDAKYAAVSVFTTEQSETQQPQQQQQQQQRNDGGDGGGGASSLPRMSHFLMARGSQRMLHVAEKMKCCEPVLTVLRPVVTRNAPTCQLDGYGALASLPFVRGPQQARFYAGVPLVDVKQRLVGALVVFDAGFDGDEDRLLETLARLATAAHTIVTRITARHSEMVLSTFMSSPLVRQSEPFMRLHRRQQQPPGQQQHQKGANMSYGDGSAQHGAASEEELRTLACYSPKASTPTPTAQSTKQETLEFYKRQMRRLVQQANATQDQLLQDAAIVMKMQGVS